MVVRRIADNKLPGSGTRLVPRHRFDPPRGFPSIRDRGVHAFLDRDHELGQASDGEVHLGSREQVVHSNSSGGRGFVEGVS